MFLFPHIVYFGCVISLYLSVHEYNVVEIEYSTLEYEYVLAAYCCSGLVTHSH